MAITDSPSNDALREVTALIDAARLQEAAEKAQALTQTHPAHGPAWSLLGVALMRQGRHADALDPLQSAVAFMPDDAGAHYNAALAARKLDRMDEALSGFAQATRLKPQHVASHYGLANALRDVGRLDQAIAAYRSVLSLDALHERAALNLGNACLESGLHEDAVYHYRQALAIKPDWAVPYFNLHAIALDSGNAGAALECLRRALVAEPGNPRFAFFHAQFLDYMGQHDRAAPSLSRFESGPPLGRAWLDAWRHIQGVDGGRLPVMTGTQLHTFQTAMKAAPAEGLVLEFGVRHGKSIRLLAGLTTSAVDGFDSFEGLPEAWHHEPEGSYSTAGRLPQVPANVTLHRGWFDASLPAFLSEHAGPVRLVNIDCDLYSSTKTVLDLLADRLVPGTVIVFDEYIGNEHWRDDEFKAFQEACARHGWTVEHLCFSFATKQVVVRLQ